jgi:hypothetical protein
LLSSTFGSTGVSSLARDSRSEAEKSKYDISRLAVSTAGLLLLLAGRRFSDRAEVQSAGIACSCGTLSHISTS